MGNPKAPKPPKTLNPGFGSRVYKAQGSKPYKPYKPKPVHLNHEPPADPNLDIPNLWKFRKPKRSLLQQPGPKKFKLFRIDLIYKAKKFKVLPLAI